MQAATQRIADILTTSSQAAAASGGAGTTSGDGSTKTFQQQQQPATMAVPVSFTHDTWNSDNYGRKLQQQQVLQSTSYHSPMLHPREIVLKDISWGYRVLGSGGCTLWQKRHEPPVNLFPVNKGLILDFTGPFWKRFFTKCLRTHSCMWLASACHSHVKCCSAVHHSLRLTHHQAAGPHADMQPAFWAESLA